MASARIPVTLICTLIAQAIVLIAMRFFSAENGASLVACYLLLGVGMLVAFRLSTAFEEREPQVFVQFARVSAVVLAIASVGAGPLLVNSGSWNPWLIGVAPTIVDDRTVAFAALAAPSYVVTAIAILDILRTLERRPSLALLLVFNPAVLLAVTTSNLAIILALMMAGTAALTLRKQWLLAASMIGVSGLSMTAVALLVLLTKHQWAHAEPATRKSKVGLTALVTLGAFTVVAFVFGLPDTSIRVIAGPSFEGLYGFFNPIFAFLNPGTENFSLIVQNYTYGTLGACLIFLAWFLYRVEVSGKDSVLFAMLTAATIPIVLSTSPAFAMLVVLLPLAAVFRSAPQLWLSTIAGLAVLQFSLTSNLSPWLVSLGYLPFWILLVMQFRHAMRETGLFQVIEVKEDSITAAARTQ